MQVYEKTSTILRGLSVVSATAEVPPIVIEMRPADQSARVF